MFQQIVVVCVVYFCFVVNAVPVKQLDDNAWDRCEQVFNSSNIGPQVFAGVDEILDGFYSLQLVDLKNRDQLNTVSEKDIFQIKQVIQIYNQVCTQFQVLEDIGIVHDGNLCKCVSGIDKGSRMGKVVTMIQMLHKINDDLKTEPQKKTVSKAYLDYFMGAKPEPKAYLDYFMGAKPVPKAYLDYFMGAKPLPKAYLDYFMGAKPEPKAYLDYFMGAKAEPKAYLDYFMGAKTNSPISTPSKLFMDFVSGSASDANISYAQLLALFMQCGPHAV